MRFWFGEFFHTLSRGALTYVILQGQGGFQLDKGRFAPIMHGSQARGLGRAFFPRHKESRK